ncbi:uncharacterized protein LAESUDRAFT_758016 [Laetiporus sulphureus 93-53]|uniref:CCHC-type domain-containing protein n=1 Tax=Laetiporus sulphureus 93-53 TaxID=1314785 RepID=A0A165EVV8_9APHY|nr:uncharacterized protein LAESUDRAFT_758016 [Laetiporus sulphureus 93-53]KZT07874.1 hypothetical protein LAESUDRAFT_758016 [Laetiporus sulphureus 93-53]
MSYRENKEYESDSGDEPVGYQGDKGYMTPLSWNDATNEELDWFADVRNTRAIALRRRQRLGNLTTPEEQQELRELEHDVEEIQRVINNRKDIAKDFEDEFLTHTDLPRGESIQVDPRPEDAEGSNKDRGREEWNPLGINPSLLRSGNSSVTPTSRKPYDGLGLWKGVRTTPLTRSSSEGERPVTSLGVPIRPQSAMAQTGSLGTTGQNPIKARYDPANGPPVHPGPTCLEFQWQEYLLEMNLYALYNSAQPELEKEELQLGKIRPFAGDKRTFTSFLQAGERHLQANIHIYNDDYSQITFILSHFEPGSAAAKWVESWEAAMIASTGRSDDLGLYRDFRMTLQEKYGGVATKDQAWQTLLDNQCRQKKGKVDDYIGNLDILFRYAEIDDDYTKLVHFKRGLESKLAEKVFLTPNPPTTYEDACDVARQVNDLRNVHKGKSNIFDFITHMDQGDSMNEGDSMDIDDPNAMDVDRARRIGQVRSHPVKKRLCYRCRKPGHEMDQCPAKEPNIDRTLPVQAVSKKKQKKTSSIKKKDERASTGSKEPSKDPSITKKMRKQIEQLVTKLVNAKLVKLLLGGSSQDHHVDQKKKEAEEDNDEPMDIDRMSEHILGMNTIRIGAIRTHSSHHDRTAFPTSIWKEVLMSSLDLSQKEWHGIKAIVQRKFDKSRQGDNDESTSSTSSSSANSMPSQREQTCPNQKGKQKKTKQRQSTKSDQQSSPSINQWINQPFKGTREDSRRSHPGQGQFSGRCWNCNRIGHHAFECPKPPRANDTSEYSNRSRARPLRKNDRWNAGRIPDSLSPKHPKAAYARNSSIDSSNPSTGSNAKRGTSPSPSNQPVLRSGRTVELFNSDSESSSANQTSWADQVEKRYLSLGSPAPEQSSIGTNDQSSTESHDSSTYTVSRILPSSKRKRSRRRKDLMA